MASSLMCATLLLGSPSRAFAFDHELQFGVDGFYAVIMDEEVSSHGGGAGLHGRFGLTDSFALALDGAWGAHWTQGENAAVTIEHLVTTAAGVHYAVDLLPVLPYLEVLVGASFGFDAESMQPHFLLNAAVGIDWRFHELFSVGAEVAYQLRVAAEIAPARLCVSLRFSWRHRYSRSEQTIE